MAVSNHYSSYAPRHGVSQGALAGLGRMLGWAEGRLGQEAGMRAWGEGDVTVGTQRPASHTSLSVLPGG